MVSEKDRMTLLYVPAGEFLMGDDAGEEDERPVHTVILNAFWIDETEVTNRMYANCWQEGGCNQPADTVNFLSPNFEDHPVVHVNWYDAGDYCFWAGRRLPTEAEWEKAASWDEVNQLKREYPWGSNLNCTLANYFDSNGQRSCNNGTNAVGSHPRGKSPYLAFDMVGNVSEWVSDWYKSDYYSVLEDTSSDPKGPSNGSLRVLRGGSWFSYTEDIGVTDRYWSSPSYTSASIGFRCAMDASP